MSQSTAQRVQYIVPVADIISMARERTARHERWGYNAYLSGRPSSCCISTAMLRGWERANRDHGYAEGAQYIEQCRPTMEIVS